MNILKKSNLYTTLLMLPYFFAVTGMLVLDSGDKKIIPLLLISIIVGSIAYKKEVASKNLCYSFIWLTISLCAYTIFSYYYHGTSSREIRALVGSTLFLIIFPYELLTQRSLRWIVLIGSITVCANSLYYNVYIGSIRNAGYINPIPYATACSMLSIIAFSLLMIKSKIKEKIIPLLAFFLSLPPIMLSEARGVWLALAISILILIVTKCIKKTPTQNQLILAIIATLVVLPTGIYLFKDNINARYNQTMYEIKMIQDHDYNTSIGVRLKLWQLTPDLFKQKPLLGHGQNNEKILKDKLNENIISKTIYVNASSHYHNQFLDKMVKSGIIGLAFVISILIYPLTRLKHLQDYEKFIVIGSTCLFFIAGLTDVPLNHPQPLMLYLLFLVPICSRCKRVSND
ncbi:O-antigen ligase family protein [Vibrio sp. L5-1]|uniref:O-antigen ligase n=1 Tax=Vibrio splendidus TaxID=29497 RepID=A0A837NR11_VIBSP|nr:MULTISPECIES: O-antigen ligase family protein [Vibrio]KPL93027.1 O-antigen ligase [Vibrio splendidus]MCF7497192.1 O-antigen ligase family protein [Vibrio sp. L5-1]